MKPAVRLALRQVGQSRIGFALLLATIVLPVGTIAAWFTLRATAFESPETETTYLMGQAETVLHPPGVGSVEAVRDASGRGSQALGENGVTEGAWPQASGWLTASSGTGELLADITAQDPATIFSGRVLLEAGELPGLTSEVAITPALAEGLDSGPGESIFLNDVEMAVVGVFVVPDTLDARAVVTTWDAGVEILGDPATAGVAPGPATVRWYVSHELSPDTTEALATDGWTVQTREEILSSYIESDEFDATKIFILTVAIIVLAELMLIISGVYSISLNRRIRDYGLLAAVGARPRFRGTVASLEGVILGVVGTVIGLTTGVLVARVSMDWAAATVNRRWVELTIPYGWLGALGCLAVVACAGSAWLANRALGSDVMAALRGDRTVARPGEGRALPGVAKAWLAVGIGLAALAALIRQPLVVLGGVAIVVIGSAAVMTSLFVSLERRRIKDPRLRMAMRVAARNPRRSSGFALVVLSLLVLIGMLSAGLGGESVVAQRQHVPTGDHGSVSIYTTKKLDRATIRAAAGAAGSSGGALFAGVAPTPIPIDEHGVPYTYWGQYHVKAGRPQAGGAGAPPLEIVLYTGTLEDVTTWLGRELTGEESAAFADGVVLTTYADPVVKGQIEVRAPIPPGSAPGPESASDLVKSLPALVVGDDPVQSRRPMLVISPGGADSIGIPQPSQSLGYLPPPDLVPDDRTEAKIRGVIANRVGRNFLDVSVERGSQVAIATRRILTWSTLALLVATVALSALMLGLARNELRGAYATLTALGASARWQSRVTAAQGATTVAVGVAGALLICGLGVPALLISLSRPITWWPVATLAIASILSVGLAWVVGRLARQRNR